MEARHYFALTPQSLHHLSALSDVDALGGLGGASSAEVVENIWVSSFPYSLYAVRILTDQSLAAQFSIQVDIVLTCLDSVNFKIEIIVTFPIIIFRGGVDGNRITFDFTFGSVQMVSNESLVHDA